MANKLLILMMIGHVWGDFYLQTDRIAELKDEQFKGVMIHSIEYLFSVGMILLPVMNWDMCLATLSASIVHFVIDGIKYIMIKNKKIKKSGKVFVEDQILHILSIFILVYIMTYQNFQMAHYSIVKNVCMTFNINAFMLAKWILTILILHIPTNILIQSLLAGYKPKEDKERLIEVDNKVGRKIGTIERLIMLMFISMEQYAAMGLVLTAKSIARYDKISKNEKFAEYYLLGTLLSTACVVCCKMIIFR